MRPTLVGLVLLLALPLVAAPSVGLVLDPPVAGPVGARFDAPTRYGPGHRGVDLRVPAGTTVRASASGRVTFAGRVVDATWVTVDHGPLRTTVGPLSRVLVQRGDRVARGSVLGTSGLAHGEPGVHWSVRRGDTYLDPLTAGRRVATLLPDAGTRPPAAGAAASHPPWRRVR